MQNFIPFGNFEPSGSQLIILFLIILWTLFWKGLALWHAVKRSERKWFIAILILNTFSILELIYLFFVVKIKRIRLD
jgi:hypothetical protein